MPDIVKDYPRYKNLVRRIVKALVENKAHTSQRSYAIESIVGEEYKGEYHSDLRQEMHRAIALSDREYYKDQAQELARNILG